MLMASLFALLAILLHIITHHPPCPLLPTHTHTHTPLPSPPVCCLWFVSRPSRVRLCSPLIPPSLPSPSLAVHLPLLVSLSPHPPLSLLSCPCPCPGCGSVVCDRAPPKATPTWIETSIGSKQSGVGPPETRNPTPIAMTERTAESPPRHTAEPHRPTQMRRVRRSCAVLDGRVGWGDQRGGAWGTK